MRHLPRGGRRLSRGGGGAGLPIGLGATGPGGGPRGAHECGAEMGPWGGKLQGGLKAWWGGCREGNGGSCFVRLGVHGVQIRGRQLWSGELRRTSGEGGQGVCPVSGALGPLWGGVQGGPCSPCSLLSDP